MSPSSPGRGSRAEPALRQDWCDHNLFSVCSLLRCGSREPVLSLGWAGSAQGCHSAWLHEDEQLQWDWRGKPSTIEERPFLADGPMIPECSRENPTAPQCLATWMRVELWTGCVSSADSLAFIHEGISLAQAVPKQAEWVCWGAALCPSMALTGGGGS